MGAEITNELYCSDDLGEPCMVISRECKSTVLIPTEDKKKKEKKKRKKKPKVENIFKKKQQINKQNMPKQNKNISSIWTF